MLIISESPPTERVASGGPRGGRLRWESFVEAIVIACSKPKSVSCFSIFLYCRLWCFHPIQLCSRSILEPKNPEALRAFVSQNPSVDPNSAFSLHGCNYISPRIGRTYPGPPPERVVLADSRILLILIKENHETR